MTLSAGCGLVGLVESSRSLRKEADVASVVVWCLTGRAAQESGARRFVYLSTATVYQSDKSPATEAGKVDPWTTPARYQLDAEKASVTRWRCGRDLLSCMTQQRKELESPAIPLHCCLWTVERVHMWHHDEKRDCFVVLAATGAREDCWSKLRHPAPGRCTLSTCRPC